MRAAIRVRSSVSARADAPSGLALARSARFCETRQIHM
jgi:hypothetical protein